MEQDVAKQKSKYTKMFVSGVLGPLLLLIRTLIVFAGINFAVSTNSPATTSGSAMLSIVNTILLIIGIVAVSGFVWGPIIGIIGIVKLSDLNKRQAQEARVPANVTRAIEQEAEETTNKEGQK